MRRRSLLQALAALPVIGSLGGRAQAGLTGVTVDRIEAFRLPVNKRGNWTVIRLKASNGLTGIGDASHAGDDADTLVHLRLIADLLRGRSIFDVGGYRAAIAERFPKPSAGGVVAASAIEHCLWDLMGKTLGVPSYDLLGGRVRDAVRLYANINRSTDPRTPDGFAAMARRAIDAGFGAIKLAPFDELPMGLKDKAQIEAFTRTAIERARAVRAAIGPKKDLLIDVHSRLGLEDGLELLDRLKPLDLYWLEEVTPADPVENLAAIRKAAPMTTAGGESLRGVAGFYPYIKAGAVDVVMPDVKVCGGLLELRKIAAVAEGAGLKVSPHGPASPVGNVAAAQVACTLPNFTILEFSFGEVDWRAELIEPAEEVVGGSLPLSQRPGFGITLNDAFLARRAQML